MSVKLGHKAALFSRGIPNIVIGDILVQDNLLGFIDPKNRRSIFPGSPRRS